VGDFRFYFDMFLGVWVWLFLGFWCWLRLGCVFTLFGSGWFFAGVGWGGAGRGCPVCFAVGGVGSGGGCGWALFCYFPFSGVWVLVGDFFFFCRQLVWDLRVLLLFFWLRQFCGFVCLGVVVMVFCVLLGYVFLWMWGHFLRVCFFSFGVLFFLWQISYLVGWGGMCLFFYRFCVGSLCVLFTGGFGLDLVFFALVRFCFGFFIVRFLGLFASGFGVLVLTGGGFISGSACGYFGRW